MVMWGIFFFNLSKQSKQKKQKTNKNSRMMVKNKYCLNFGVTTWTFKIQTMNNSLCLDICT